MLRFRLTPFARAALVAVALLSAAWPGPSLAAEADVTTGSPLSPFPQNKQNEPGLAIDASHPTVVAAGANDEIDLEACAANGSPNTCPFTPGVGTSGIYFFNGATWDQPTYPDGLTARDCVTSDPCTAHPGPIGTLPRYRQAGLVSDGDPSLAFGPRPGPNGFAWANGSRLYYANLTANVSAARSEATFKGFEAIAVSRTDDLAAAKAGDSGAWMPPVIVSRQNSALFSDHEQVWADNAASSAFFGNVYVCLAAFRSQEKGNAAPAPIVLARSTDGGDTWNQRQISPAVNNGRGQGRQDCGVRTDSRGTLYVFWQGGDVVNGSVQNAIFLARSFDGGQQFERPRAIAHFDNCGLFDAAQGSTSFDGVAGARDGSFPSLDIANAAPTGAGATDRVVVTWCDGPTPTSTSPGANEQALVMLSNDRGDTFGAPVSASPGADRPDFPAIAISPDGTDVYLVYDNFQQPWQTTTANPRLMQGVVRHADVTGAALGAFTDMHRAPAGDARGSSANALSSEFLGDYNNVAATNDHVVAVWNDVRAAADCPAVDTFRQAIVDGGAPTAPALPTQCPAQFGNSDIWSGVLADPTP